MKDTFDLRKFLTENKVTAASQQSEHISVEDAVEMAKEAPVSDQKEAKADLQKILSGVDLTPELLAAMIAYVDKHNLQGESGIKAAYEAVKDANIVVQESLASDVLELLAIPGILLSPVVLIYLAGLKTGIIDKYGNNIEQQRQEREGEARKIALAKEKAAKDRASHSEAVKSRAGQTLARKEMVDKRSQRVAIEDDHYYPNEVGLKRSRLATLAKSIEGYENEEEAYEYIFGR